MLVDEAFTAAETTYSSNPFPVAARGGSFDALAPHRQLSIARAT
jgi:hypothetical protein